MKKLQTLFATLLLAVAMCAPVFAGDGQMGTGGPGPKAQIISTDDEAAPSMDVDDLLLAAEITVWQNIIALF